MAVVLSIVPKGFAEAEKLLAGMNKAFPRAANEAINKGLIAGRKVAVMGIRQRYNIKSGVLKGEGMVIKKPKSGIGGALDSKGPMLPVSLFSPTGGKVLASGKRKPVQIMVVRGKRKIVKGGFLIAGTKKVLERRQPQRYPIFTVSTIGVPFMIAYQGIAKKIQETIEKVTSARLEHNVKLFLSNGPLAAKIGSRPS